MIKSANVRGCLARYSSLIFNLEDIGGCHSSVVSSTPTILQPQFQIPSTPSMLFSICITEIVMREG